MLPPFGSLNDFIRSQNKLAMEFTTSIYDEKSIQTLEWHEHRRRPGRFLIVTGVAMCIYPKADTRRMAIALVAPPSNCECFGLLH